MTAAEARVVRYLIGTTDMLPLAVVGVVAAAAAQLAAYIGWVVLAGIGIDALLPSLFPVVRTAVLLAAFALATLPVVVVSALIGRARGLRDWWRVAALVTGGAAVAAVAVSAGTHSVLLRAGAGVTLLVAIVGLTVEGLVAFGGLDATAILLRGGRTVFVTKALIGGMCAAGWIVADALNVTSRFPALVPGALASLALSMATFAGITALVGALAYLAPPREAAIRDAAGEYNGTW